MKKLWCVIYLLSTAKQGENVLGIVRPFTLKFGVKGGRYHCEGFVCVSVDGLLIGDAEDETK